MICPGCVPWNTPLTFAAPLAAEGHIVPLRFEGWVLYHYHVVLHQANRWSGEIEQYVQQLKLAQNKEISYS